MDDDRYDIVSDIIQRNKNNRKIYSYKTTDYWRNISTVDGYYNTNMDFLKPEVRNYFFRTYPDVYSKVEDLPPAKYNPGADVSNSLISGGCIVNGKVDDSVVFKQAYIGNNSTIKNCIILNDVYIGDNVHLENCIVESHGTIKPNTEIINHESEPKIIIERNFRYGL